MCPPLSLINQVINPNIAELIQPILDYIEKIFINNDNDINQRQ